MRRVTAFTLIGLALATLAGCGTTPPSIIERPTTARPSAAPLPAPTAGAIFNSAGYRPMFEDHRARMVGDMVTITISESTSAAKSAANSASKSGSISIATPTLFGKVGSGTASGSTANKFEEKDATTATNTFTGTITATVIEVLPNGNLVVSGEKQVSFDKGVEYVRVSGVVSPDRVGTGNTVPSTQIADARIEYRTNSRIDKAEFMSQVARFFMSMLPL
ncbi:MAG TPA: flagellar basal body L-ring protein FlgH [Noviherbaspirillum sp.]